MELPALRRPTRGRSPLNGRQERQVPGTSLVAQLLRRADFRVVVADQHQKLELAVRLDPARASPSASKSRSTSRRCSGGNSTKAAPKRPRRFFRSHRARPAVRRASRPRPTPRACRARTRAHRRRARPAYRSPESSRRTTCSSSANCSARQAARRQPSACEPRVKRVSAAAPPTRNTAPSSSARRFTFDGLSCDGTRTPRYFRPDVSARRARFWMRAMRRTDAAWTLPPRRHCVAIDGAEKTGVS